MFSDTNTMYTSSFYTTWDKNTNSKLLSIFLTLRSMAIIFHPCLLHNLAAITAQRLPQNKDGCLPRNSRPLNISPTAVTFLSAPSGPPSHKDGAPTISGPARKPNALWEHLTGFAESRLCGNDVVHF